MTGCIWTAGTWPNSSADFNPDSMLAAALPFSRVHVCSIPPPPSSSTWWYHPSAIVHGNMKPCCQHHFTMVVKPGERSCKGLT